MSLPNDRLRRASSERAPLSARVESPRTAQTGGLASLPNVLAALATALVIASGALLERPEGGSTWPPLALFALAITLALTARVLGARMPGEADGASSIDPGA